MWSLSFVQCIVQVPVYFYITGYDNSGLHQDEFSKIHEFFWLSLLSQAGAAALGILYVNGMKSAAIPAFPNFLFFVALTCNILARPLQYYALWLQYLLLPSSVFYLH